MTLADLVQNHRPKILEIARRNGATKVRIFGSVARGDEQETSDIDILCEMEPGRSLLDLARLERELEEALHCNVDVVTERGLRSRIRDRVLAEARPL